MPVETFATNIMGTANVLEAVRQTPSVAVAIIVTSDKVYAESAQARHDEAARLGGHDPYSASKACAELVTASFPMPEAQKIATVRSGNVIGGGDWAAERLLPDFFRSMLAGEILEDSQPTCHPPMAARAGPALRLSARGGVLMDGAARKIAQRWNFGPDAASEVPVADIAAQLCALWGERRAYHIEAADQARRMRPRCCAWIPPRQSANWLGSRAGTLAQALGATVDWFRALREGRGYGGVQPGSRSRHIDKS